jgi:NADP-dependent 3-hydroxy acid dehydrogenase YdfG
LQLSSSPCAECEPTTIANREAASEHREPEVSMSDSLRDQVGVVVGASSGMGRATALLLAQSGMTVAAAARRKDRLQELSAQPGIHPMACDVTDRAQVVKLMEDAHKLRGRIDLLVYASGTNVPDRALTDLSAARWQELIDTNLTGAFHCTQAVLPHLRENGGGLIIYLSSAAVQRPDVSGVAYQASKHGLVGLAHGTRVEEKCHGIRTSVIFPGLCDTEILARRPQPTPQDTLAQALAPEDVAAAVLFLAQLAQRALVPELQLVPARL